MRADRGDSVTLDDIADRFKVDIDPDKLANCDPQMRLAVHNALLPIAFGRQEIERLLKERDLTDSGAKKTWLDGMMERQRAVIKPLWELARQYEKHVPWDPRDDPNQPPIKYSGSHLLPKGYNWVGF